MAVFKCVFVVLQAALFVAVSFAAPSEAEGQVLEIPPECVGQRFCSVKPKGYEEYEKKMNSILPEFLKKEYADRSGTSLKLPVLSSEDDWHNCPYVTKTEVWYTAYSNDTTSAEPEIIVQSELFAQHIETVSCAYEYINGKDSVQCFQDLGVSPAFGMKSECVNSFAERTLYVFDIKRNLVVQKPFKVSACCKCKVEYNK